MSLEPKIEISRTEFHSKMSLETFLDHGSGHSQVVLPSKGSVKNEVHGHNKVVRKAQSNRVPFE